MAMYHANEFTLELPEDAQDKTVHIFALPDRGPSGLSIVVARERPQPGEALDVFAERTLVALSGQLPVLTVLGRERIVLDGRPALGSDYTWSSSQGKVFQRQVITYDAEHDLMLVITGTCRDSLDPRFEGVIDAFLAGFRFRSGAGRK